MSVDPWLAVEAVGVLVALTFVVYGVAKLDIKLTVAAGVVTGTLWLLAAWTNPIGEAERRDYTNLHFRVTDKATSMPIQRARVRVIALDDANRQMRYRLPLSAGKTNGEPSDIITVSLFVNRQVRGSLHEQFRHPEACLELEDQVLEVVARGYQPWRGSLKQLLTGGHQVGPSAPIVIELQPRPMEER